MKLNSLLTETVKQFNADQITEERRAVLQSLIKYINEKMANNQAVKLNFICTHNSRRSQFSQIWAQTAAYYHGIEIESYSGGVEVTAFNERAVEATKRAGFHVTKSGEENPRYSVYYAENVDPVSVFSKVYDDEVNPTEGFAAVMTCSHADENCPFIPGTEKRIPVRYDDPKEFDNTPLETAKYDERSIQIANEMFYVFSQIGQ